MRVEVIFQTEKSFEKLSIPAFKRIFSFEKRPPGEKVIQLRPTTVYNRPTVYEKLMDFRPIENTTLNTAGEESFITFARWGHFSKGKKR